MALGGTVYNPHNGTYVSWKPVKGVADEYNFIQAHQAQYDCLGVIGNDAHLEKYGSHTPWCNYSWNGRQFLYGWVYAVDIHAPRMLDLEKWLVAKLKAGKYPTVYFININNRQYSKSNGFSTSYYSSDAHLHLNYNVGSEYTAGTILQDYHNEVILGNSNVEEGFLMALTDAEQADLLAKVRAMHPFLTNPIGSTGKNFRDIAGPAVNLSAWNAGTQTDLEALKASTADVLAKLAAVNADLSARLTALSTQNSALSEAVKALALGQGVDPAAIEDAAYKGARKAELEVAKAAADALD